MAGSLQELKNFDIRSIDLNNIGVAPMPVRIALIVILSIAILGLGYYLDTRHQRTELEKVERIEQELRAQFEQKQRKAANLEAYRAQLDEMRRSFGTMLRQLPSKTEIPNLIIDISQTGLASGLEIELFRPRNEQAQGFYAEKPITLRVRGAYREMGDFASGVAALPRIVTLHNISLTPTNDGQLVMDATAKTYRYLDDDNQDESS
jgi:type IV pilus assembly protein PilO